MFHLLSRKWLPGTHYVLMDDLVDSSLDPSLAVHVRLVFIGEQRCMFLLLVLKSWRHNCLRLKLSMVPGLVPLGVLSQALIFVFERLELGDQSPPTRILRQRLMLVWGSGYGWVRALTHAHHLFIKFLLLRYICCIGHLHSPLANHVLGDLLIF